MAAQDARLATVFEPMFGVTFTPTRIRASEKINVIPSSAELRVDCRVPPGIGGDEVLRGIGSLKMKRTGQAGPARAAKWGAATQDRDRAPAMPTVGA